jgi:hypothetical protein
MMLVAFATTAVFMLHLWTACAVLTLGVHVGVSLTIDRRFDPGSWEKLALALLVLLGPLGSCLEVLLVLRVWRDIRPQLHDRRNRGRADGGPASAVLNPQVEIL